MKFTFVPDYIFNTFDEVSVDFLQKNNIKAVISDIDNTLEPYENAVPSQRVLKWLSSLTQQGIACAFVSNNNKARVELFNAELGLVAFYKAGKPFSKNVKKAMDMLGVRAENTILLGDQVFTDVWAARNAGIRACLVPPIKDKTDVLTKFKRLLEKPVLKKYSKIHKEETEDDR